MAYFLSVNTSKYINFRLFVGFLINPPSILNESVKPHIIKMCNFCEEQLVENSCQNMNCTKPESLPKGERTNYETIIFDAKKQIIDGLEKNWEEILDYKGTHLNYYRVLYFLLY